MEQNDRLENNKDFFQGKQLLTLNYYKYVRDEYVNDIKTIKITYHGSFAAW